jgi:hypothetical protein
MPKNKTRQNKSKQTQKTHENMLYILGHKGNANQNQTKIQPYNNYHQEHKQQQMLVSMWQKWNPHILPVGM